MTMSSNCVSELQATLEFCIELHKFYNVDLFLRGFYQLQTSLRVTNTKLPVRVEINNNQQNHHQKKKGKETISQNPPQPPPPSSVSTAAPPSTTSTTECPSVPSSSATASNSTGCSRPFRILFRNEELELRDIILFRVHFQLENSQNLNIQKLIEDLNKVQYLLDIKLCFNDVVVSARTLEIHLQNMTIHYYRPVFFDYFHLCAVSFSIHGGLIAFHITKGTLSNTNSQKNNQHQPDLIPSHQQQSHQHHQTSTSCVPSSSPSFSSSFSSGSGRLSTAKQTHESIMNILTESNGSLKTKLIEFLQVLGKHDLVDNIKTNGFVHTQTILQDVNFDAFIALQKKTGEETEEFLLKAHKQIAHLCAENILLWHRFLDLIISKDQVRVYLANLHHQLRVKRFSEGFYITENPLRSAYTSKDYTPIVELLKKSINHSPLPVECTDIDGDALTIPIIFEDQFNKELVVVNNTPHHHHQHQQNPQHHHHHHHHNESSSRVQCKNSTKKTVPAAVAGSSSSAADLLQECNCGIAELLKPPPPLTSAAEKVLPSHSKSLDLIKHEESLQNKIYSSASTLPRRHSSSTNSKSRASSQHHHHENNNVNVKKAELLRKFNSTPLLNELKRSESSSSTTTTTTTSEESGWVSNNDECESVDNPSSEDDDGGGAIGGTTTVQEDTGLLPPPIQFQDIVPPEPFRDDDDDDDDDVPVLKHKFSSLQYHNHHKKKSKTSSDVSSIQINFHSNRGEVLETGDTVGLVKLEDGRSHEKEESQSIVECSCMLRSTISSSSLPLKKKCGGPPAAPPTVLNSTSAQFSSSIPYFLIPDELRIFHPKGLHLIICVHGLDGSCHDLRLFKIYLEVSLPGHNIHFLMSEKNQVHALWDNALAADGLTFSDFERMTEKFITEINSYIETNKLNPTRISFVGHSLGNIIIRSALTKPSLAHLLPKLHTFLSLSGPHLGTLYNTGIVNMGMWLMQKWKKSCSLLQLSLKDNADIRKTFMYKLSEKSNLNHFKFVLLCGSAQDRYVPVHSAHIINCKHSLKDFSSQGEAYREMVMNMLSPILTNDSTKLIRYDVHHAIQSHTANSIIGRAAHIAVLDSEIFIEKFLSVSAVKYFQ